MTARLWRGVGDWCQDNQVWCVITALRLLRLFSDLIHQFQSRCIMRLKALRRLLALQPACFTTIFLGLSSIQTTAVPSSMARRSSLTRLGASAGLGNMVKRLLRPVVSLFYTRTDGYQETSHEWWYVTVHRACLFSSSTLSRNAQPNCSSWRY